MDIQGEGVHQGYGTGIDFTRFQGRRDLVRFQIVESDAPAFHVEIERFALQVRYSSYLNGHR
jgi:hypothetical protein